MRAAFTTLPLLCLVACGSTSTSTFTETITVVPTTINGVPVTNDNIGDQPGVTVTTGTGRTESDLPEDEVNAYLDAQDIRTARSADVDLLALSNSRWVAIPTSGTVDYSGTFAVTANNDIAAGGDFTMTANFNDDTISAEHGPLYGYEDSGLVRYDGEIAFTNGQVGAGVRNDVSFDVAGTIASEANTIDVDGTLEGKFMGTPVQAVWAYSLISGSLEDDTVTVTLNGQEAEDHYVGFDAYPD